MSTEERIGEVTHYYGKIKVAVIQLTKDLNLGEKVHFRGENTDFTQEVTSMQIEHEAVSAGKAGTEVAIKVKERVRPNDRLFRLSEEE